MAENYSAWLLSRIQLQPLRLFPQLHPKKIEHYTYPLVSHMNSAFRPDDIFDSSPNNLILRSTHRTLGLLLFPQPIY